jgi:hypothetical protein
MKFRGSGGGGDEAGIVWQLRLVMVRVLVRECTMWLPEEQI